MKNFSSFFFAGFVPTFGPAFIHLYGSTRDYNFIDEHSNLNDGLGEGVSYRGRIMIALKTDISDSIDTAPSEVEVMATQTINEVQYRVSNMDWPYSRHIICTMCDFHDSTDIFGQIL